MESHSPWAFAAADSLPFEIHSDGVGAGVGGPHCLQGPAKFKHSKYEREAGRVEKKEERTQGHFETLSFREIRKKEVQKKKSFQLDQCNSSQVER